MSGPERYELLEQIAAGGMGAVFRAEMTGEHGFRKAVAVKRILAELAGQPELVNRFVAEANLAVSLSHANIVQVFNLGRMNDELFLVMELVDGADFGKLLSLARQRFGSVPLPIAIYVLGETLKGLAYAHERRTGDGRPSGIVHCDISPSNLLLSYAGEVKIADFGIAQALEHVRARRDGRVMGKKRYMAPERLRGEPVDARIDLFALAVVIREALGIDFAAAPELIALLDATTAELPNLRPQSAASMLTLVEKIARTIDPITAPQVGAWVRELLPARVTATSAPFDGAIRQLLRIGARTLQSSESAQPSARTLTFVAAKTDDSFSRWELESSRPGPRRRSLRWIGFGVVGLAAIAVGVGSARTHRTPASIAGPSIAGPPIAGPSIAPRASTVAPAIAPAPSDQAPVPTIASDQTGARVRSPRATGALRSATSTARPPPTGFLNIYAEPWAKVSIDGAPIGTTPLSRWPLRTGPHRVHLENPSTRAIDRVVHIESGETQLLDVDLDK